MIAYLKRLLDTTDQGVDLLNFAVLAGLMQFVVALGVFLVIFMAHAFFPARVAVDLGGFVGAVGTLGTVYVGVLSASSAAMRWRK